MPRLSLLPVGKGGLGFSGGRQRESLLFFSPFFSFASDNPKEIKKRIKAHVEREYGYDFSKTLDEIRPSYSFDVSCQGSVPQAITAFLESADFENAIRIPRLKWLSALSQQWGIRQLRACFILLEKADQINTFLIQAQNVDNCLTERHFC